MGSGEEVEERRRDQRSRDEGRENRRQKFGEDEWESGMTEFFGTREEGDEEKRAG